MKFSLTKDCSDAFADKVNQTITRRESEGVIKRTSYGRKKCIWIADRIIKDAHLQAYESEPIIIYENIDGVSGDDVLFLDTLVKDVLPEVDPSFTWRDYGGSEDESGFSINTRSYSKDDFFTLYNNAAINKR